ncbi:glycosyltransferase [Dyella mobilis]|uniref:Glycosyltransferase n=1 Tax=Dyella mobilis TaxID=1849582 RepID=A0ABS2KFX8_9GAMM|nr:glycosyltransferase [Dyella mobilis]MBM7130057.1 glycosyltransferase [Dyella mobilis]GLQ96683.1 hypothetical protein GCM10007863_11030 [Dyella mobilis]
MRSPLISVCIVTYNQESYIRQCVESVLAQGPDVSLEILVGDDCSSDRTGSIVKELADLHPGVIRYVRNASRLGPSENIQAVLARVKGEFVAHLDGDDYWLPGKLKKQLAFLESNPGCAAVYTNAFTVNESGGQTGFFNDVRDLELDLAGLLRRGNFLNASSMCTRAELIKDVAAIEGPFIDYRAHLRYARYGFVAQIAEPLVGYRVNSTGSMVLNANDRIRQLYWEALMDVPRAKVSDIDFAKGMADFLRRVTFRAIRMRRWSLIREWAPRVFEVSPYGSVVEVLLTLSSILRVICSEAWGRLVRNEKVLYRR